MRSDLARIPVAFSMGDPNGIGPEVLLKSLQEVSSRLAIDTHIFADRSQFDHLQDRIGITLPPDHVTIHETGSTGARPQWGQVTADAGRSAVQSLVAAVTFCREHDVGLLVTPPICKEAAQLTAEFPAGQTEYIASFFPGHQPAMAFFSDQMHVLLATVHIPLSQVPKNLNSKDLIWRISLFHEALLDVGIGEPTIALCGLNPHASESGLLGSEEEQILLPALDSLEKTLGKGVVTGPYPPDTIFRRVLKKEFDGAVALYHDQGLIPLKLVAFQTAVNTTLGLPIVRTSPDHGTAFDIAGRGQADPGSMIAAVEWGLKLALGRLHRDSE